MVGADDAFGQLGPGVRRFVGQAGAAQYRDCGGLRLLDRVGREAEGLGPGRGDELVVLADQRLGQPLVGLDRLEVEATVVAQPTPVHRVDVDALVAQYVVATRLDRHATPDRAGRARGLDLLEIPWPRLEAE